MNPDTGTAETPPAPRSTGAERGDAPMLGERGGPGGEAMARIGRLVATIKAERHADRMVQPIVENGEHDQLVALLRRFVVAREQERQEWEETLRRMTAELAEAQARRDEEASRHQRDLADLELLHEHQRSIWNLDRRRLEITIDGVDAARTTKRRRKRLQLAAGVAALLSAGAIGLAIAGNGGVGETSAAPRHVIDGIRSLSRSDLPCVVGCERPPEPVQQGRL
jgi:hypothetical protein